jgi:hypothetical protein
MRIPVNVNDLQKRKRYFLDDYSKCTGYFEEIITKDDGSKVAVFTPIINDRYAVQSGFVRFKIPDESETFYL